MDSDFLLIRAKDLLVLGVHLHDVEVVGQTATAVSADACIVLVLPPQHIQEQTTASPLGAPAVVLNGECSGPSRLAYAVAPGTVVTLTADGVLAACRILRPGGNGPHDTSIEMPSRLALGPLAGVSLHPTLPLTSPSDVAGVWLARLSSGTAGPLQLRVVDRQLAGTSDGQLLVFDPWGSPSLNPDRRTSIADQSQGRPIVATRLEVSTRGGNLTAGGDWDGIEWTHRITGGRDQFVRVDERVLLYPFGFHAVLTTLTERDPDVNHVLPGEPAVLRRTVTLRLGDTVKATPDGSAMSRTFPFDRVEVTRAVFGGLGPSEPSYVHKRDTTKSKDLREELQGLTDDAEQLRSVWGPYVDGQVRDLEDLRRAGDGRVQQFDAARSEQEDAGNDVEWLAEENRAYSVSAEQARDTDDEIARLERGLQDPGGFDEGTQQRLDQLRSDSGQLWAEARTHAVDFDTQQRIRGRATLADKRVAALWKDLNEAVGQPRDVHDAVNLGDLDTDVSDAAKTYLEHTVTIADLKRKIAEITALVHDETITEWPRTPDGKRLIFPVRLSRGPQVVDLRMPMILVKDYSVPAALEYDMPAYSSLEDLELAGELDTAWAGPATAAPNMTPASVIDAGGVRLDVVGAAVPKPADSQVVRTLNLVGGLGLGPDLFTPSLGRLADGLDAGRWSMGIDLPALQTLAGAAGDVAGAPGHDVGGAAVAFARQYVEHGEVAQVLFKTIETIGIDFTRAADRSGGLAALQLAADGISRDHGPVQLAGLLADPDPAALIGEAATLLGFKLRDLLRLAPDLEPPTMVSEVVEGGRPRVRLEWHAGPLGAHLAFKPTPQTRLSVTVLAQVDGVVTDCEVNDFSLTFPFDKPLVKLTFGRINFHQQTTYGVDVSTGVGIGSAPGLSLGVTGQVITHPPKLTIDGFHIEFLGPLLLLKSLQDAVDLAGKVPGIRATPKGVTATFALPVPDVSCGVFALSNLAFHSQVDVPFDNRPVAVSIGFASRDKPFSLSVLSFAGGGYVDIHIDASGPRIEASLEFGARMEVNFIVAKGEVHALGGVQYLQDGAGVAITGYIRIGGSLEILSVISVSVELRIALAYDTDPRPRLVGRATLVLEIDLTLWSTTIEIDSGEWVLTGGGAPDAPGAVPDSVGEEPEIYLEDPAAAFAMIEGPVADAELAAWRAYRASFAGGRHE